MGQAQGDMLGVGAGRRFRATFPRNNEEPCDLVRIGKIFSGGAIIPRLRDVYDSVVIKRRGGSR